IVLRAIDKADKFPLEEVRKLLGTGRKDESGDYTKGAGLDDDATKLVLQMLTLRGHIEVQTGNIGPVFNPRINTGSQFEEIVPRTLTSTISVAVRYHVETSRNRDIREILALEEGLRELETIGQY